MFKDIVKASRSYRGYDESYHFIKEELEDFVDCARYAPSSVNAQPFRYYLAWEKEEVAPHPETDKLGKGAASDAAPAPGDVPDRIYHHLSGLKSGSIHSEISERCRNCSTDHAPCGS